LTSDFILALSAAEHQQEVLADAGEHAEAPVSLSMKTKV
jgi:hypothetical protein